MCLYVCVVVVVVVVVVVAAVLLDKLAFGDDSAFSCHVEGAMRSGLNEKSKVTNQKKSHRKYYNGFHNQSWLHEFS